MIYRKESGEAIDGQSWVMRNIWDTKRGYIKGLVTAPKKLKSSGVKRLMEDALWTQGLRKKLPEGKRRHEFQTDHDLRKWFKIRCELSKMQSINIEELMNHSTGISNSYYRVTESQLLEDYLNAVPFLTISPENRLILENSKIKYRNDMLEKDKDEVNLLRKELEPLLALKKTLEEQGSIIISDRVSDMDDYSILKLVIR
jgi:hypothetical protein